MASNTVTAYLEADHRRLDDIAKGVAKWLRAGSVGEALRDFEGFAGGLNRHIDAEEQVLFPAFEELTGVPHGPTAVMRAEHVEIRRRMAAAVAAMRAGKAPLALGALAALVDLLSMHNKKEEGVLYPWADEALGTTEARTALVRDMRQL
jgi:hemerythrin-like domain-containing protein